MKATTTMKNLTKCLLLVATAAIFTGCIKKSGVSPDEQEQGFNIVGEWKVSNIQGVIDSAITINNQIYKTTFKTSYDSVSQQMTQTINDRLYAQFPYALTIKFNSDNSDVVSETMMRYNSMGVATPYDFTVYNSWNYTTTKTEADGLVIRGFENTHVLGLSNLNPAQGSTRHIETLLAKPFFTTYDVKNGHLVLFVHVTYTGNPDTPDGNGGFYNPYVAVIADYEITFTKK